MKRSYLLISAMVLSVGQLFAQNKLTIDVAKKGADVPSSMYGIFFEEISHGGEGGLYAEMIQNRAFEDHVLPSGCTYKDGKIYGPAKTHYFLQKEVNWSVDWKVDSLSSWSLNVATGAEAKVQLTSQYPLNSATPHAAQISIVKASADAPVSFVNSGFWGVNVQKGEKYNLRMFLRSNKKYKGSATVKLVSANGEVLASQPLKIAKAGSWIEFQTQLLALGTDNKATLQIAFDAPGTIQVDFVSLFPEKTFMNRPNGLRADVAQMLVGLQPAFIRWPGGCIVEGATLENRVQWKQTIGDPVQRPGQWDVWGYRNTYGWGYHEFLQFCEDIHSEGMFVINVGLACEFRNGDYCADDEIQPFIQDALDAIEYAIGDVSTKYGAMRAANGHPQPFPLKYVEIGNENRGPIYYNRHNIFYKELKAKYPQIQYILNTNFGEAPNIIAEAAKEAPQADIADLHWYESPDWFFARDKIFDNIERPHFKAYVGEYACNKNVGDGNLYGALSEAAFMTGMERNSDLVTMTSYAPLFENSNLRNWPVNLIWMQNDKVFGRTSYHVQKLFAQNRPSYNVATNLVKPDKQVSFDFAGKIGLATYNTSATFKDVKITTNGQVTYQSNFSNNGYDAKTGNWKVADGLLSQSEIAPFRVAMLPGVTSNNCVVELKARKDNGMEGFIILFGAKDDVNRYSVNIAGWNNAYTAFEKVEGGLSATISSTVLNRVDENQWYDVKIVLNFPTMECYINGQLVQTHTVLDYYKQYAQAGYDAVTKELVIKVINAESTPFTTKLNLENAKGLQSEGRVITLSGNAPTDENSFQTPDKIVPVESNVTNVTSTLNYEFKPYSFTILRLKCE